MREMQAQSFKKTKTFNSPDSLLVTDATTNESARRLTCMIGRVCVLEFGAECKGDSRNLNIHNYFGTILGSNRSLECTCRRTGATFLPSSTTYMFDKTLLSYSFVSRPQESTMFAVNPVDIYSGGHDTSSMHREVRSSSCTTIEYSQLQER